MTAAKRRAVDAWLKTHEPRQCPTLTPEQDAVAEYWDRLCAYWGALWFLVNRHNVRRELRQMYGLKKH